MKKIYLAILLLFLITSCSTQIDNQQGSQSTSTTTLIEPISSSSTTSSTTYLNPLVVKSYEELPNALVRIVVKSSQAELNEDLEIKIFEYEGSGSGFFISSDGYIVTNNHVVSGSVTILVYTQYRAQPYSGTLVGLSECDDLAVIKIDIEDAQFLNFSSSEPILGEEIIAAGFPLGDEEVTFLNGIVSKKQTDGSTSWASIEYAFEHTAEILPGSSGGPIVNKGVEVVGIAYAGNDDRQEFGIPIVVVEEKIYQIIDNEFKYSFNANVEQFYGVGVYVYSVDSNSPYRKVGINGGEIITAIKGVSVVEESTLKIYCDAMLARNPNIGISYSGLSIEKLEEFEVEVSLDGTVANELSRTSLIVNNENSKKQNTVITTTTTTTLAPVNNSPKYEYDVPDLVKIDTFTVSDYVWEVKIYLNYPKSNSGLNDGFENIKHCSVELLAPPYFDNSTKPFTKLGQLKRQQNCYSERINDNEIIITHIFDVTTQGFSWESINSNEIPIGLISLFPTFDADSKDTYDFKIVYSFAYGDNCSDSEHCSRLVDSYSKPDIVNTHLRWLYDGSNAFDTGRYRWIKGSNYGNQYGTFEFSSINSNNYCSKNYKGFESNRMWTVDNNAICIKR